MSQKTLFEEKVKYLLRDHTMFSVSWIPIRDAVIRDFNLLVDDLEEAQKALRDVEVALGNADVAGNPRDPLGKRVLGVMNSGLELSRDLAKKVNELSRAQSEIDDLRRELTNANTELYRLRQDQYWKNYR